MATDTTVAMERGYSQMRDDTDNKPARRYQDVEWAVIFLLQAVGVGVLAVTYSREMVHDLKEGQVWNSTQAEGPQINDDVQQAIKAAMLVAWPYMVAALVVGLGWAVAWIVIVQAFAETLIWVALIATPIMFGIMSVVLLAMGNAGGVILLIPFLLTAVYAAWIITTQQFRIRFAKLTLKTVASVVHKFPGTWLTAFFSFVPATLWLGFWGFSTAGTAYYFFNRGEPVHYTDRYGHEQEGVDIPALGKFLLAFLILSQYWTAQVISNVVHVTISGTVATWYYQANRMPARPTLSSLGRALTTSFGSICLGSLLVALVQMLRDAVEEARRRQEGLVGMVIMCCITCIMSWIEALIEIFNHWAFVQVAVYGKDFKTAARDTWQLVQTKGLTALVNMNLTSQAVAMGALIGASLTGVIIGLVAYPALVHEPSHDSSLSADAKQVYTGFYAGTITVGVLSAVVFASMVSSTITSGVTTVFVCWAEDPAALQQSNPELHQQYEQVTAEFLQEQQAHGTTATYQQPYQPGNSTMQAQQQYGAPGPAHQERY